MGTGDHEFHNGGSAKWGCALKAMLLGRSDPSLQAFLFSRALPHVPAP
jgi:hypothetical protein